MPKLETSDLWTMPTVDVMAMAGLSRVMQPGGSPRRDANFRSAYRTNIDRNGVEHQADSGNAWRYAVALLRLRGL